MLDKAGIFLGEAIIANKKYPIERIKFKDVSIEETGLYRILEAVNANHNIKRIHVGIISDYGLTAMAQILASNVSLVTLEF